MKVQGSISLGNSPPCDIPGGAKDHRGHDSLMSPTAHSHNAPHLLIRSLKDTARGDDDLLAGLALRVAQRLDGRDDVHAAEHLRVREVTKLANSESVLRVSE